MVLGFIMSASGSVDFTKVRLLIAQLRVRFFYVSSEGVLSPERKWTLKRWLHQIMIVYNYNASDYMAINLENYTNNKIKTHVIHTNKPDIQNNGFGLQQIKTITIKYQWKIDIESCAETKKSICYYL